MPKILQARKKFFIILIVVFLLILVGIISLIVITFSNIYRAETSIPITPTREIAYVKPDFKVKTILLKNLDTNCTIEVLNNGYVTQYCGDDPVPVVRKVFSSEKILKLFSNISEKEF
ncbi:hypothetical protein ACFL2V_21525, partial [Pseudomonadota bacterium]